MVGHKSAMLVVNQTVVCVQCDTDVAEICLLGWNS